MARAHVEFLQATELPLGAHLFNGQSSGLRSVALSADPATGAETLLARAAPCWRWPEALILDRDLELLVLEGTLRIGQFNLDAGRYLFAPAGTEIASAGSESGALALCMLADALHAGASKPRVRSRLEEPLDIRRLPWRPSPSFEGRPAEEAGAQLAVKMLRRDPQTSAYTLLTRHARGWRDLRLESHATWEELLLLEGDYLMGATGMIAAGSYIFRPPTRPHGPQATRSGAVWFCRGEREIDFRYQDAPWAAAQVEEYLSAPEGRFPALERRPWGCWSED